MHYLITGGAGFIGSNLADTLLAKGHRVTVYDNFSTGRLEFLENATNHTDFTLVRGDLLDKDTLTTAMTGVDMVFHLAANADVRFGTQHPSRDLEQNTIATFNVLEAMRAAGVKRIGFSSTGSIYGEPDIFPTPEYAPFPIQTSLYGASKLAGEGLLQAYAEGFGFTVWIFRFVSVLGERYTHGHVFDFMKKLGDNPYQLPILGDGKQRKSYIYIKDCIAAILTAVERAQDKVNIFNLGTTEYTNVTQSAGWICRTLNVTPELVYSGGERGWIGDSPFIFLDTKRILSLGWEAEFSIEQAVVKTVEWIHANSWVFERA